MVGTLKARVRKNCNGGWTLFCDGDNGKIYRIMAFNSQADAEAVKAKIDADILAGDSQIDTKYYEDVTS